MNAVLKIDPIPETRSTARRRCAVVECYNRHDEVYLTTVHLLQRLGYEVQVFNTWRNRVKDSFVHAPGIRPRVHSRLKAEGVLEAVRQQKFDLVVMNTFEGAGVLECAKALLRDTPVVGFLHNGDLANKPEYAAYLSHPRFRLMALAPYIAAHLAPRAPTGSMVPVFFFDRDVPKIPRTPGRRRFCVQGYFDPGRRDYRGLLASLAALRQEGREDFEVYVMGRTLNQPFRDFTRQVRDAGLDDHLRYTWKGIGYRSYYRLLNSVDFVLPLITPESHPAYFQSKSTSSIAAAVGFNAIPVTHEQLARYYGIEDVAFTYTNDLADDLLSAMRRALDMSDDHLDGVRSRLQGVKQGYLDDSLQQLRQAISGAGVY